jgi:hypothetical protein
MSNEFLLFFESVEKAAETLTDPRAKSQLLSELAHQQLLTKQFDAALQTFAGIDPPSERRIALLTADFGTLPPDKIAPLVQLLEANTETKTLAGRLARPMAEVQNIDSAWKMIETAETAFVSEEQRYGFLKIVLPQINENNWEKIPWLHQTFTDEINRDWASLAIIKFLAGKKWYDEVETFALPLVPIRRSWAYWEMYRLAPKEQSKTCFDKAVEVIETIPIDSGVDAVMEMLATQLRIFGHHALLNDWKEQGEKLLERSEAAATAVMMPMQRYRLQCFLGKVLLDWKQIDSIQNYLPMDKMLESVSSASDRSRMMVWLAEAGWNEGWKKAIEILSVPERGILESDRAKQIAVVLNRSVAHRQCFMATGDHSEDAVKITGEEFESYYYNPFAVADCGC